MNKSLKLSLCILVPLLVGSISGYFTSTSITTWYVTLNKPSFNPPNYLFGPVWTTLYILMGISLFLVLNKAKDLEKSKIIFVFSIQLILNFLWSFLFFKFQQLGLALAEILLMWCSILFMIIIFYKTNKLAALINIPYLFWVSFATILTYSIYTLN
jgi:tryptophan-rich sensory protein